MGKTFSLNARYAPPPSGIPAPVLWGEEAIVRDRLGGAFTIATIRRELVFDYPFSPREVVQFFRQNFGPTKTAFSKLDAPGQEAFAADMEKLWSENNEAEGNCTKVRNEYLEVIATRTGL